MMVRPDGTITWMESHPSGTLVTRSTFSVPSGQASFVRHARVNGDFLNDFVVTSQNGAIHSFAAQGFGFQRTDSFGPPMRQLTVGDIDGNFTSDIAGIAFTNPTLVQTMLSNGTGGFFNGPNFQTGGPPVTAIAGGVPAGTAGSSAAREIVAVSTQVPQAFVWAFNNGATPTVLPLSGPASAVAQGDVTGDGLPDIVAAVGDGVDIVQRQPGGFLPAVHVSGFDAPTQVAPGDVSGDGRPAIVTSSATAASLLDFLLFLPFPPLPFLPLPRLSSMPTSMPPASVSAVVASGPRTGRNRAPSSVTSNIPAGMIRIPPPPPRPESPFADAFLLRCLAPILPFCAAPALP